MSFQLTHTYLSNIHRNEEKQIHIIEIYLKEKKYDYLLKPIQQSLHQNRIKGAEINTNNIHTEILILFLLILDNYQENNSDMITIQVYPTGSYKSPAQHTLQYEKKKKKKRLSNYKISKYLIDPQVDDVNAPAFFNQPKPAIANAGMHQKGYSIVPLQSLGSSTKVILESMSVIQDSTLLIPSPPSC